MSTPSGSKTEHGAVEHGLTKAQIKRATRTRKVFTLITAFFLLITVVFLILVEVAGTRSNQISTNWYFLQLDLSDIVPTSIPNAQLLNSIARTLGLHDFYRVYLWNFCEGYDGEGVTFCASPQTLYWFNPIEILQSELLAGASIQLPADINTVLDLVQTASLWMFSFFLAGAALSFILMFLVFIPIYSRWLSLLMSILTFLNAALILIASAIATVMFIIFRNTAQSVAELNIRASVGIYMFAFMWVASAFAVLTFVIHLGLCCCCASRRDVRTGRRQGSKKARMSEVNFNNEKRSNGTRKRFWKRSD